MGSLGFFVSKRRYHALPQELSLEFLGFHGDFSKKSIGFKGL
jgi:hypothetical protein